MKHKLLATGLIAVAIFGAGQVVGQVGGTTASLAASTTAAATPVTSGTADLGHGSQNADGQHADGTVTAINGNTLTISAGTDPVGTTEYTGVTTVNLTSATQYDAGHDSTAAISQSSITIGSYVIVDGTLSSDGKTLSATSLRINAGGPVPGR